jgi:hypothetical protein
MIIIGRYCPVTDSFLNENVKTSLHIVGARFDKGQ